VYPAHKFCGNTTFHATAHVTQTWLVDEAGEFIKAETNCDEVTHSPDAEDLFECSKCGAEVPAKYVYSE
jgi:hypothetical protein